MVHNVLKYYFIILEKHISGSGTYGMTYLRYLVQVAMYTFNDSKYVHLLPHPSAQSQSNWFNLKELILINWECNADTGRGMTP